MKTRKDWRDAERQRIAHLEIGSSVRIGDRTLIALLDDADELARLREGLWKEIAMYRGAASPMLRVMSVGTIHRVADRLEALLNNGDGDGN